LGRRPLWLRCLQRILDWRRCRRQLLSCWGFTRQPGSSRLQRRGLWSGIGGWELRGSSRVELIFPQLQVNLRFAGRFLWSHWVRWCGGYRYVQWERHGRHDNSNFHCRRWRRGWCRLWTGGRWGQLHSHLEISQLPVMSKVTKVRTEAEMENQLKKRLEGLLEKLGRATTGLAILLAFVVVIPLTLWSAWTHRNPLVNQILLTFFCVSFGWLFVSMLLCYRTLRRLGLDGQGRLRLFSGPRPDDQEELRAWQLGWHFMYAVLAVLFCIIALPVASWLSGK